MEDGAEWVEETETLEVSRGWLTSALGGEGVGVQTWLNLTSSGLGDSECRGSRRGGPTGADPPAWRLRAERIVWKGKGCQEGAEESCWLSWG